MPALTYQSMLALARKASVGGAKRRSMTSMSWEVHGDCENPIDQEFWSRPAADHPAIARRRAAKARISALAKSAKRILGGGPANYSWEKPLPKVSNDKYITVGRNTGPGLLTVQMTVRCRQCKNCRKVRSRMWYSRAIAETLAAKRTWFGTITLHPDANHASLARARSIATKRGHIWEHMTPLEQFAALHRQNGVQLQLWLKRVRKQSGARIRFLLVCEAHKSGLPHYHCLIHETDEVAPVRHKVLADQWKLGFTNFKLVVDPKQAGYLCKYLSKSALARVRASARYGQTLCSDSEFNEREKKQRQTKRSEVLFHDTPKQKLHRSNVYGGLTKGTDDHGLPDETRLQKSDTRT